jgi:3-oxoadipate enol-lactonase
MSKPSAIDVHYKVEGTEAGPLLVLSHALGASMAMWNPQVERISSAFRVIRYDQRGHGASPVPPGPYAIEDLGRDLLRLLDRLELRRVSFCGLSLGGMVGMWLAINAPDRLDRLVLCCTAARMMRPQDYGQRAAKVRAEGMAAIAEAVVGRWLTPDFAATHSETVAWLRSMLLTTPAEGYAATCEALQALDLLGDLSRVTAPTLVIAAAEDQSTPVHQAREIGSRIAGSKMVVISGASHMANVERPAEVSDYLLSFVPGGAGASR